MDSVLKILMVEDLIADAEVVRRQIQKGGISFIDQLVDTRDDYINALLNFHPDIILSEYSMPSFNGRQALLLRSQYAPGTPFVMLTGMLNEEETVEVIKEGADDYIIKEHPGRLGHAIRQAMEKKKREKKTRLLAFALENITECVWVTDQNNLIIYANATFHKTYGYHDGEVIGKDNRILMLPGADTDNLQNRLPGVMSEHWRGEVVNLRKDGTPFSIMLSTSGIRDEQGHYFAQIHVASDITQMIRTREELVESKTISEEANRLKSALLNNLNHEIRTPMNSIMGFAGLMAEANPEEKTRYASIIEKSSGQLLSVIDEVMLLSRLQSEKMAVNLTSFNPGELVKSVSAMFNGRDLRNGVSLRTCIPEKIANLLIISDTNKIRQILTNLILNAIKYTFEGSIEIGISLQQDQIEFYVADTGIGIPVHEQQKVFETFYRAEQAISSAIGGTGLGLSISRELVGLLDGQIGVTSVVGEGSRFFFKLPIAHGAHENITPQPPEQKPEDKDEFSLLIVDDEEINLHFLETILKNRVKKIDRALNGLEAVELASRNNYTLILMDIKMPVMNGLEATRILIAQNPTINIVAQTAFTLPEEIETILQAGCRDVLCKPIRRELLLEQINKYR